MLYGKWQTMHTKKTMAGLLLCIMFLATVCAQGAGPDKGKVKSPHIQSYQIESPFQHNSTTVRILLPDDFDAAKTYKVLYVLPVVANDERKYGDGLSEIIKYNYHNTSLVGILLFLVRGTKSCLTHLTI